MVHTYPTKIVNSHGETMNTTYDYRFGKPLTVTDPTGSTMTYRYDFAGRLVTLNDLPNQRHVLELIVELMFYTMGYYLHPPKAIKKSSADFLTDQFIQLVDFDHRSHHQIEYYAQQLNVSAKYLAECVKQTTQRTATNWIKARLLADAKHLLNTKQMSIKEIANTLNFASQSNFGRFFKRLTGTSPLAYRKRQ